MVRAVFVYEAGGGEYIIIMLKGENAVTKRVSELPQKYESQASNFLAVN